MRQYFYKQLLGYNDKTVHLSELIRDGQITRDEALARLDGEELMTEEVLKTCCSKTGMDLNELNEIFKNYALQ